MQINNNQCRLLSFRNAYYQGYFNDNVRQGPGIAILDHGVIVVSNWDKGQFQGKTFVFFGIQQYGYLQYSRGLLDGYSYICSERQLLVIRFEKGQPIQKQLLVNFNDNTVKLLTFKSGSYQVIETAKLQEKQYQKIVRRYLGIKMYIPTLTEFLQGEFSYEKIGFETKVLSNGNVYFRFVDDGNPLSLGFVVGKREQLVSYGCYLDGKLHGWGKKYDSSGEQEGQFENGQLHGYGFNSQNHKYSFGKFSNGNLIQSNNAEERSSASHLKLKDLRKKYHIQSLHFNNSYLPNNIVGFKGISQIKARPSLVKEVLYSEQPYQSPTSSHLKGSNFSLNQILSSRMQMRGSSDVGSVFNSNLNSIGGDNRQEGQTRRWGMGSSLLTGGSPMHYPLQ